ncbi:MAG TPA: N-acetylmuramoyl-L-alanine amidase [Longimicrobiales bacterium]|nr:N-acetylmuramoyl-L-alanine amidase [Longimicrobiales bacterium]
MIRRLAFLALLLPAALAAQSAVPPLHVQGTSEPLTVTVANHRGYPAYPAWTLRTLGAKVDATMRGVIVVMYGDTLTFENMSPFFTVDGAGQQLAFPVYREGGIIYFPQQLFAEWLPDHYPHRLRYQDGTLRVLTAADSAAAPDTVAAPTAMDTTTPLVVIDPGHGGVDPGRIAPGGGKEKDLVLRVSKRLRDVLEKRGYEVRMTRTTDTLIGLMDRPRMANEWKGNRSAALFISIHANGVSDSRARGFETFFLSDARTDDERRVAEMENASLAYEDASASHVGKGKDLEAILSNLRNDFYIHASHQLAALIQGQFDRFHPGPDRGVKQAGFVVLVGAFMPAVLVELGFISNRSERHALETAAFQQKIATGIADAVARFFSEHRDLLVTPARERR